MLCLASMWLVGCDGSSSPTSTFVPPTMELLNTPTPTATPPPTPTPTPTPPVTPTPECAGSPGRVETGSYYSQILGRDMLYRAYVPACYGVIERPYPVLYLLHGYPFDESHWDRLGVDEVADSGIRMQIYPQFIIVLPNCDPEGIFRDTSGGDLSVEGLVVNELIPHIDSTYATWAAREGRAIGGISRGGVWSLEIAFRHPSIFAIVGSHSAALSVNYPHPVYDPLILATDSAVQDLRIYLDAGDADWARYGVEGLVQVLEEQGVEHQYFIGEGEHADEYWASMLSEYLSFYTAGWSPD